MSYLLDTCVLSELTKQKPDSNLLGWYQQTAEAAKFVSVITLGELWYGILCSPAGTKRTKLLDWFHNEWRPAVGERLLGFDEAASQRWAAIRADYRGAPVLDAQIAATALEHKLALVTRNVKDFPFRGLAVLNPWKA